MVVCNYSIKKINQKRKTKMSEKLPTAIEDSQQKISQSLAPRTGFYKEDEISGATMADSMYRTTYLEAQDHMEEVDKQYEGAYEISDSLRNSLLAKMGSVAMDDIKKYADKTADPLAVGAIEYFNKFKSLGEASRTATIFRKAALYDAHESYDANKNLLREAALDSAKAAGVEIKQ